MTETLDPADGQPGGLRERKKAPGPAAVGLRAALVPR